MNKMPQPAATNTVIGTLPVEGVGAEPGVGGRVHRPVPLLPSSQYCAAQLHSSQRNAVPGRANRSLKKRMLSQEKKNVDHRKNIIVVRKKRIVVRKNNLMSGKINVVRKNFQMLSGLSGKHICTWS